MNSIFRTVVAFLVGVIGTIVVAIVMSNTSAREETFGSLAHHTRIALAASKTSNEVRPIVGQSIETDLRVILMRYPSFSAEEQTLLQLVRRKAIGGEIALSPAMLAKLDSITTA